MWGMYPCIKSMKYNSCHTGFVGFLARTTRFFCPAFAVSSDLVSREPSQIMTMNTQSEFAVPLLGDAARPLTGDAASLPGDEPQPSAPPAFFKCDPGETPRAFGAFKVFFELGHDRSLSAVADQLGEHLSTVKKWSGRHRWFQRIADFEAGLLPAPA